MAEFNLYKGLYPAIITSYKPDGSIDVEGIKQNVKFLLDHGCSGVAANGCTGEAFFQTHEERIQVIKACVEASSGLGKVIAGTGSNVTSEAIKLTQDAKNFGADLALVITPYALKPRIEGILEHYKEIAAVGLPVIVYHIPVVTGITLSEADFDRLFEIEGIIGVKDTSGDLGLATKLLQKYGKTKTLFTGGDNLFFEYFALGTPAAILALGNLVPEEIITILNLINHNDVLAARDIFNKIYPIAEAIGSEENFPMSVKEGVAMLGRPSGGVRLPIISSSEEDKNVMQNALMAAGLL